MGFQTRNSLPPNTIALLTCQLHITPWSVRWRILLSSLLLCLLACEPWQDPLPVDISNAAAYTASLANTEVQLQRVKNLRPATTIDSLLQWTVALKDKNSDAALLYAREAVSIATERGYKKYQAVGRYYIALLEGGYQVYQEGLADPLVNARMALKLWPEDDQSLWPLRFRDLLGELHYRKKGLDSAEYYFESVWIQLQHKQVSQGTENLIANSLHGLGNVYMKRKQYEMADSLYLAADKYCREANDVRGLGILYCSRAKSLEKQKKYQQAIDLLNSSHEIGVESSDQYVITNALQGLGDVNMRLYRSSSDLTYFNHSLNAFRQSQAFEEDNPYYTNGRIARLMQSRASREPESVQFVDSAILSYKLALEQARERGALNYFKNETNNIANLCDWLMRARDRSCEDILGFSITSYLYTNYVGVVDTITLELVDANTNQLNSELTQQEVANKQRIRNNWGVSGGAILVLGLVFLLLWQQQKQRRLEARMEALRAQINPHFFSNSLNAIESLINLDQKKAAAKYVIHFSRLTRRILNSSLEPTTSLQGELATTEHFLALEQLRFKDKLYYDIEVAPEVSPEGVEIPSLILQPYLENAIWHGIKPKSVPSLLQIKIYRKDNNLHCVVEDDGIGREAAAKQKEESVLKQKSVGMKITKERLKRFGGGKVDVIDLYTEEGKARGTRVHLTLPYKTIM